LRTDSSPEGKLQEALWQLAYRRHPYQWPVIGYPSDLLRITTPVLIKYFKTYFQPANAALVVVGDFKPDVLMGMVQRYYGKISAQARPDRKIPDEPEQREEHRLVIRDGVVSERFAQAYHITSADQNDSYSLDVLANILFEGTNSRAYRRLIDEKDFLASISGSAYTPAFPGLFMISGTLKGNLQSSIAEKELDRVIGLVQEKGVTEEEVKTAVKQLTVQLVDSVKTPYGLGQLIGTVQSIFGEPDRFASDLSKYMKVTPEDVKRVAQKYLIPNNRSVVNLLPKRSGDSP
jgi:zinc protease